MIASAHARKPGAPADRQRRRIDCLYFGHRIFGRAGTVRPRRGTSDTGMFLRFIGGIEVGKRWLVPERTADLYRALRRFQPSVSRTTELQSPCDPSDKSLGYSRIVRFADGSIGNLISTIKPPSSAFEASIIPRCRRTARAAIERPRPVPPVLRSRSSSTR